MLQNIYNFVWHVLKLWFDEIHGSKIETKIILQLWNNCKIVQFLMLVEAKDLP